MKVKPLKLDWEIKITWSKGKIKRLIKKLKNKRK